MAKYLLSLFLLVVCIASFCNGAWVGENERRSAKTFDMNTIGQFMECMRGPSSSSGTRSPDEDFASWMGNFSKCIGQANSSSGDGSK